MRNVIAQSKPPRSPTMGQHLEKTGKLPGVAPIERKHTGPPVFALLAVGLATDLQARRMRAARSGRKSAFYENRGKDL